MTTRRALLAAAAGLLVFAGATSANDRIPCEWFPTDDGAWVLVDPDCESLDAPRHDAIATFGPRVTLPPTDTVR